MCKRNVEGNDCWVSNSLYTVSLFNIIISGYFRDLAFC